MPVNIYYLTKIGSFLLLIAFFCNGCCNKKDEYGFSEFKKAEQKDLIKEFVKQLQSDPQGFKKLKAFIQTKAMFEPISKTDAMNMFDRYVSTRRRVIEPVMIAALHNPNFQDTRSVVIETQPLFDYLLDAMTTGRRTGVRLVFSSYDYDPALHNPQMGRSNQRKSGQQTVFFVTTLYDSSLNGSGKYKYFWRDSITNGAKKTYRGLTINNHGELCPDSCGVTDFQ